ncbi:L-lactate dehydrogenase [Nitrosophilus kaiyonis]|uniref:L-lactate dehydrogenase n=1 Tax=Nitrosophilus kaiyonis TaxID=2930200 RepID=UPI0024928EB2|nr:L-lactate dehydrogenase [Nitrosophilus kaiyonis]
MHIGIIGAGNVGVGIADALTYLGIGKKITLFNRHIDKALGEIWDLSDCIPLLENNIEFHATDDLKDLKDCNIIAITAGIKQKPGQSRMDLLNENLKIIKNIVENLDEINEKAIIIMVTNPVDILTRVAINISKRDKNLIFGSGTVLDSIRFREAIGEKIDINRKNIHAYIIGEHGDSEFPLWSATHIGPLKLEDFNIKNFDNFKKEIALRVKKRAYKIIEKKGFTKQAIGVSVANIIKSIILDEKKIFTVSVPIEKSCGCIRKDVCLSIPCVLGEKGIEKKLLMECSELEFELLKQSAEKLDKIYAEIAKETE